MFEEVLHIKPRLEPSETRKMENALSTRFTRVASRFGHGLSKFTKAAVGGSIFGGIGLSLINKILNPLEKIDERIKSILSEGQDVSDVAEKYGGTPAQLFQLEKLGENAGLTQEQVRHLLNQFYERQGLAIQELANPALDKHKSTVVLGELAKNTNTIEAFTSFLNELKGKSYADRTIAERSVFETKQTGAARRLIDTDFDAQLKTLGLSNVGKIEEDFRRLGEIKELDRVQKTIIENRSFLNNSEKINPGVVTYINQREGREQNKLTRQMSNLSDYQKLQATADKITDVLEKMTEVIGRLLVKADELIPTQKKMSQTTRRVRISPTGQTRWE